MGPDPGQSVVGPPEAKMCDGIAESPSAHPAGIPASRAINIGVEDLVDPTPGRLAELARRLDQVDANVVSIAVGRVDWVEFPWVGHEDQLASDVIDTGRDYVGEAISAFRCGADGRPRTIVLGIDVLLGRSLGQDGLVAGRSQAGVESKLFASVATWRNSGLGDRLTALAEEVATRYRPEAVNITELFFDLYTYGEDDLADFRATTGLADWPRREDGGVDTNDPAVGAWRTEVAVSVLAPIEEVLSPLGVALTADVRAPQVAQVPTRADIGQHYPELLEYVASLNVWDFPGVGRRPDALTAADLGPLLFDAAPDRFSLEIGLWSGPGVISADALRRELVGANRTGMRSVSVTPASRMTEELWDVVEEAWGGAR
ncbi:MAG TPA: hypothetical protein PJ992_01890 [Arachnia sp.]|nr:hypothetical protein [Arachnia sp.]HMR12794.1 hypothetical protein [Arachnia sp.]